LKKSVITSPRVVHKICRIKRNLFVYYCRIYGMPVFFFVRTNRPSRKEMKVKACSSSLYYLCIILFFLFQLHGYLEKGNRLSKPKMCPEKLYNEVMLKCWNADATQRPSFYVSVITLREIMNEIDFCIGQ